VKPPPRQEGALTRPLFTLVRTTMVDPLLKVALEPSPSPMMLNSAAVQPCQRLTKFAAFSAE
jgi:hypothetical protein